MPNINNRTIFEADNLDILRAVNSKVSTSSTWTPPFKSDRNYAPPGDHRRPQHFADAVGRGNTTS